MNLYNLPPNTVCSIESVPDSDVLKSLGIIPGATVKKLASYGAGGPAMISLGNRNIAVGKKIAEKVIIEDSYHGE